MNPKTPTGFTFVVHSVAAEYQLEAHDLLSRTRREPIVTARQLAMWMLRRRARRRPSYNAVGHAFERDHGTVIHAVRAVNDRLETEPDLRRRAQSLCRKLNLKQP